jgi:hypothetical protein
MITKEEADKIMKTAGEVRSAVLKIDREYVRSRWGEAGLRKVDEELQKVGYPIEFQKLEMFGWVPVGWRVLSLLAIKEGLNLTDEDIKTMGTTAPKLSFIVKLLVRFFLSPVVTIEHTPEFWTRHYTAGKLKGEYHGPEKFSLMILTDFTIHPLMCKYLEGYFQAMHHLVEGKTIKCEELECVFRGASAHVFKSTWE